MEYTSLGSTGMTVSRLCLGCFGFGDGAEWMLGEDEARPIIERAIDLGINFFDTANAYSSGRSEEILGSVLGEYDRDRQVIATKVFFPVDGDTPNAGGLSRKTIEHAVTDSLDRLGIDTIDLYQIHRWDYDTPIEETLRALDDTVRRGQVRYLGASSMWAHQFADALHTSARLDLEGFASMQNLYNLVYREEEREMLPLCEREGIGVIPWAPLARGFLTRPVTEIQETTRGKTGDHLQREMAAYRGGGGEEINRRVAELADEKGITMAQLSLSWLLHKDRVDAPIVGTTSVQHLEQAVEALDVRLTDSEIAYLEEPYEPVEVTGNLME